MFLTPYHRNQNTMLDPFRAFDELQRSFFGNEELGAFRTDIRDNGDELLLEADLPGFRKEDINIDLSGERMTITAERHSEFEKKDEKDNFLRCERSYGSFSRSFDTAGIDTQRITAAFQDGVLTLHMPKQQKMQPETRRLEIQ